MEEAERRVDRVRGARARDGQRARERRIDPSGEPRGSGVGAIRRIRAAGLDRWIDESAALLRSNRVEVDTHRYTRPAPGRYEQQWLWDSCFHAIVYRWIDPAMARAELLSLIAHQVKDGPDAGMIPHLIYWRGSGEGLWPSPRRSTITQPPLLAVAAMLVYQISGDRNLLASLYPSLCEYHAWFARRRDPDGDGLVSIIHPWESGWDASPRWDRALGLRDPSDLEAQRARRRLAAHVSEHAADPLVLAEAGLFHVEPLDFNAILAADLEALAAMARVLGRRSDRQRWQRRAALVQAAVRARLMEPGPRDLEGLSERPIEEESAAGYIALFGGCASVEQARRLVDRLRAGCNWPSFPVPTTPTSASSCRPDRYWRGNAWPPINWLIFRGLRRYGYRDLARDLAARTARLVEQAGFWEYYHPINGRGLGADRQSWSALVLDMLACDRQSWRRAS